MNGVNGERSGCVGERFHQPSGQDADKIHGSPDQSWTALEKTEESKVLQRDRISSRFPHYVSETSISVSVLVLNPE